MATYPDWLMKYKTKGIYVKKGKNGYSLYRGHSERIQGKKYPVFKCDEYLGIVTEKDGLIPSSPPVKPGIEVYRYGFFYLVEKCFSELHTNLEKRYSNADLIYSHAILGLEGIASQTSFNGSWLNHLYPELEIEKQTGHIQESVIERVKKQIHSKLQTKYGEDLQKLIELSANVYAVHVNGKWFTSTLSKDLQVFMEKYDINFSIND